MAKGIPTDPLLSSQWHLGTGTWSINVQDVWEDYTGEGVIVAIMDDGFEYTHPDLIGPYRTDLDYDYGSGDSDAFPVSSDDEHGTAVAGLITGDDNGVGTVGVAFDSEIIGYRVNFGSLLISTLTAALNNAAANADIMNNSWGFSSYFADNFNSPGWTSVETALVNAVQNGRGGLGTNIFFAGGNDRASGIESNMHSMTNSPYTIAVAGINQDGTTATATDISGNTFEYSSQGSNILISAPATGIYTTDRQGAEGYSSGNYTGIFGGTSSASPIVAGVAALMLEANPDLGYRDVQEILALSARKNDPTDSGWQTNGAGLHFNHDFGFGLIDAHAAVRMAETWNIQQTYTNMTKSSNYLVGGSITIPTFGDVDSTINVTEDIVIEHVLVNIDLDHTFLGDLVITLTSPDGMESVLLNRPVLGFLGNYSLDFEFTSVAHWGESSLGSWTLNIDDQALGDGGTLNSWSLQFWGNSQSADDLYVFTDERLPGTVSDTDGGMDTLNLAAITSAINVDLGMAAGHTVGAQAFSFNAGSVIENVFTGDGNDIITGSAADNYLRGGRGDDRLIYTVADNMSASDIYDGDKGDDTLQLNFSMSEFMGSILDELRSFLDFLGLNSDSSENNGTDFIFTTIDLIVSDFENLDVYVDGILTSVPPVSVDDVFTATSTVETFDGMAGNDTVQFINSASGVTADLLNSIYTGGDAQGDTLISIENLTGSNFNDVLRGDNQNNIIMGLDGDDLMYGEDGDDELTGGAGFNNFVGGQGNDTFYGWVGIDNARYDFDPSGVNINFITGVFEDGWGTFDTFFNIERIYGSAYADVMTGSTFRSVFRGGGGNDMLTGSTVGDFLYGEADDDIMYGLGSNDELFGGGGNDDIYGGDLADKLFGDDGDDELFGESGFDTLVGGQGNDLLDGGANEDRASYETSTSGVNVNLGIGVAADGFGTVDSLVSIEYVIGSDHGDVIIGDGNNNLLLGGDGMDSIDGAGGDDTIDGGAGDDFLYGLDGFDKLIGGAGNDVIDATGNTRARVTYKDSAAGINLDLGAGIAQDGLGGLDTLINLTQAEGSNHSDIMVGSDVRDYLYGLDDMDVISGGLGGDIIFGGFGDDVINGNEGYDRLSGSFGADRFIFDTTALDGAFDTIIDFNASQGDVLDFAGILSGYSSGDPITDFIMITSDGTNNTVFVDTDGGADSFQKVAVIEGVTGLTDEALQLANGTIVVT